MSIVDNPWPNNGFSRNKGATFDQAIGRHSHEEGCLVSIRTPSSATRELTEGTMNTSTKRTTGTIASILRYLISPIKTTETTNTIQAPRVKVSKNTVDTQIT